MTLAFSEGLFQVEENPPAKFRSERETLSLHSGAPGLLCTQLRGQDTGILGPEWCFWKKILLVTRGVVGASLLRWAWFPLSCGPVQLLPNCAHLTSGAQSRVFPIRQWWWLEVASSPPPYCCECSSVGSGACGKTGQKTAAEYASVLF